MQPIIKMKRSDIWKCVSVCKLCGVLFMSSCNVCYKTNKIVTASLKHGFSSISLMKKD